MSDSSNRLLHFIIISIVLSLLFSGCALVEFTDTPQATVTDTVSLDELVGQTFVADHAGLHAIEFFLVPGISPPEAITLHLRESPEAGADIATATVPAGRLTQAGYYRFSFPPLADSHGQYYYATLEAEQAGDSDVGVGPRAAYLNGAAYHADTPIHSQAAFRLHYDTKYVIYDVLNSSLRGIGLVALSGLLFLVPGISLLELGGVRTARAPLVKLALAAGLGVAFYPLFFLLINRAGVRPGVGHIWIPLLLGAIFLLWRHRPRRGAKSWMSWRDRLTAEFAWPAIALGVVLACVFAVRLLVIRNLDAPLWGDSVQHAVITQLIVDNGGLFDSWEPYAPYESLTVHFGFHTIASLYAWTTSLDATGATLVAGQVLNGVAILTLYPLAVRIADGNRWAGVGAVLVAGMLMPMPSYYVNWGRYPQLAGQVVLPAAIWLTWEAVEQDEDPWRIALPAGIAVAGMALAYYRMPFYYVCFILVWLLTWGVSRWRSEPHSWSRAILRLSVLAGTAGLVMAPWALHVINSKLATTLEAGTTTTYQLEQVLRSYQVWRDIAFYVPVPLLLLSFAGLVWGIFRRQWSILTVGLWVLSLVALVAGRLINLPGANLMQNFTTLIMLYIPASLVIGWLIGQAADILMQRYPTVGHSVLVAAIILVAVWGMPAQLKSVDLTHALVTRPDVRAMEWIREETPEDAVFLVEGFRIYSGSSAVGADAGWWIPLFAGRANTMPPQYAMFNERPSIPQYTQKVVSLVATLEEAAPTSPEGLQALCDWGITHIYVGQTQGQTGVGVRQLYSTATLLNDPAFDIVYSQDHVRIFAIKPNTCDA